MTIEVSLDRVEDGVAEFYAVDKADQPGKSAMWCGEEELPEDYVVGGVFLAEVDTEEMRIKELEYLPDRTEEHKIEVAKRLIEAEDEVKSSGDDSPTEDEGSTE